LPVKNMIAFYNERADIERLAAVLTTLAD